MHLVYFNSASFHSHIWSLVPIDHCCVLPCSPLSLFWPFGCTTPMLLGVNEEQVDILLLHYSEDGGFHSLAHGGGKVIFCCPGIMSELKETSGSHCATVCIVAPHNTRLGPGNSALYFYFLRKKGIFVRVKSKSLE